MTLTTPKRETIRYVYGIRKEPFIASIAATWFQMALYAQRCLNMFMVQITQPLLTFMFQEQQLACMTSIPNRWNPSTIFGLFSLILESFFQMLLCNFSYIFSFFELNGTCYDTSVLFCHDTKIEHLKHRVILQYSKNSLFEQTWCTNALYFAKNLHGMLLILSQKQIGESVTSMILFLFLIYFFCLGSKFHFLT